MLALPCQAPGVARVMRGSPVISNFGGSGRSGVAQRWVGWVVGGHGRRKVGGVGPLWGRWSRGRPTRRESGRELGGPGGPGAEGSDGVFAGSRGWAFARGAHSAQVAAAARRLDPKRGLSARRLLPSQLSPDACHPSSRPTPKAELQHLHSVMLLLIGSRLAIVGDSVVSEVAGPRVVGGSEW